MYWFEYDAEAAKRAMLEEMQEEREEGRAEGRAEGLAEGRTKGLAEGRTEGLAEGRTEGHLEMVKNFIKAGASIDFIQKATGWSEEKLLEIANSD